VGCRVWGVGFRARLYCHRVEDKDEVALVAVLDERRDVVVVDLAVDLPGGRAAVEARREAWFTYECYPTPHLQRILMLLKASPPEVGCTK